MKDVNERMLMNFFNQKERKPREKKRKSKKNEREKIKK